MSTPEQKQPFMEPAPVKEEHKGLLSYMRNNFVTGIVVLTPLVVTLWLLKSLITMVDDFVLRFVPPYLHTSYLLNWYFDIQLPFEIRGMGLLVGFLFIITVGVFARNFLGKQLFDWGEGLLNRIPGVRSVYLAIKQVLETVTTSNSKSFREVVLIEYPRKGIWAIGFVSGETEGEIQTLEDDRLVNVFLPTTPNPTSGFLLFVPKKDLRVLHMTVEQGIKLVISAGIVTPSLSEGKAALKQAKKAKTTDAPAS
jgi:uncharacterized membrane protein